MAISGPSQMRQFRVAAGLNPLIIRTLMGFKLIYTSWEPSLWCMCFFPCMFSFCSILILAESLSFHPITPVNSTPVLNIKESLFYSSFCCLLSMWTDFSSGFMSLQLLLPAVFPELTFMMKLHFRPICSFGLIGSAGLTHLEWQTRHRDDQISGCISLAQSVQTQLIYINIYNEEAFHFSWRYSRQSCFTLPK